MTRRAIAPTKIQPAYVTIFLLAFLSIYQTQFELPMSNIFVRFMFTINKLIMNILYIKFQMIQKRLNKVHLIIITKKLIKLNIYINKNNIIQFFYLFVSFCCYCVSLLFLLFQLSFQIYRIKRYQTIILVSYLVVFINFGCYYYQHLYIEIINLKGGIKTMSIKNDSLISRKSSKFPNTADVSNLTNPETQKEKHKSSKSRHHKNSSSPRIQLQNQSFLNFNRTQKQSQKINKVHNFSVNDQCQNQLSRQESSLRTSYRSSKIKQIPSINQNDIQLNMNSTNKFNSISHDQKINLFTNTAFRFISQNKKYKSIYDNFQKNNRKLFSTIKDFKQKQEYDQIKQFISKQLYIKQNQQEFKDKFDFSISKTMNNSNINNSKSMDKVSQNQNSEIQQKQNNFKKRVFDSKKINSRFLLNKLKDNTITIQQTSLQKEKLKKNLFFSDHRKVINLEQKCMLLQYYYKDQQKHKLDIKYLRKLTTSSAAATSSHTSSQSRHKRISKKSSFIEKTYLLHRESQVNRIQKIMYVKEDKAQLQAIRDAKKNYTFKRQRNFKQMEQIIKENHQHLMLEEQQQNEQNLQESIQQNQNKKDNIFPLENKHVKKNFNKFIKLFMNFAVNNEVHRIYFDYIDLVGIQKLRIFLQEIQQSISTKIFEILVGKILKYKSKTDKNIKFYDFIQLITQIDKSLASKNKNNMNKSYDESILLKKIQLKHSQIFQKSQQNSFLKHQKQIQTFVNQNSINVHLKFLFNKSQNQHKHYIPVKNIASVFQAYKLISNQLSLSVSKVYQFCMWVQAHKNGLNFNQFSKAVFMMCINNKKWKEGAKNFFQKLRKQINM